MPTFGVILAFYQGYGILNLFHRSIYLVKYITFWSMKYKYHESDILGTVYLSHIYWTKVKTLHIYSSSEIAFISFLKIKMKSHMKISSFGFHLLETHVQGKW